MTRLLAAVGLMALLAACSDDTLPDPSAAQPGFTPPGPTQSGEGQPGFTAPPVASEPLPPPEAGSAPVQLAPPPSASALDSPPRSPVASASSPALSSGDLTYDYLTKLRLDVANVVLDDSWVPPSDGSEHVESLATPLPVAALGRMVKDRLVAAGGSGQATVSITDAALTRAPGQLVGAFAVSVALPGGADGTPAPAPIVAAVSGTRILSSDNSEQATANSLLRDLMDKMNIELEFQLRRQAAQHLASGSASTALPPTAQSQDLTAAPAASTDTVAGARPDGSPDAGGPLRLTP